MAQSVILLHVGGEGRGAWIARIATTATKHAAATIRQRRHERFTGAASDATFAGPEAASVPAFGTILGSFRRYSAWWRFSFSAVAPYSAGRSFGAGDDVRGRRMVMFDDAIFGTKAAGWPGVV